MSGTVSGAIAGGVPVRLGGAADATTTTSANGAYTFTRLVKGTYTLTPVMAGYSFGPTSLSATVQGDDVTGQDFVATAHAGTLDARFGAGGTVLTGFSPPNAAVGVSSEANALAIQSDGKIVAVGHSHGQGSYFTLARHGVDGSLDPSFGNGGRVMTAIGPVLSDARGVAIQVDGKLVVAGTSGVDTGTAPVYGSAFTLARYEADGRLDADFGVGGIAITGVSLTARAVAIQADGRIVVAGSASISPGISSLALVRYDVDGRLDPAFGAGGIVITAAGGLISAWAVAVQADGKIVAAGWAAQGTDPIREDVAVARFDASGNLDGAFGAGGVVTVDLLDLDAATSLALQPDGKIIAAGQACRFRQAPWPQKYGCVFALVRLDPDGTLDASFGTGGTVSTAIGAEGGAEGVALQPDGKIVVAGASNAGAAPYHFALARHDASGRLDSTFGDGGIVTTAIEWEAIAHAVAIGSDGKITAAGYCSFSSGSFSLARYWP